MLTRIEEDLLMSKSLEVHKPRLIEIGYRDKPEDMTKIELKQLLRLAYGAGLTKGIGINWNEYWKERDTNPMTCYGLDLECEMVAEEFGKFEKILDEIITITE